VSSILDRILGPKQPSEVHSSDDPLDPVDADEIYNRIHIEEDPREAYPDVPGHIGFRRPHADQSGVDTFFGLDTGQPAESDDSNARVEAPSGTVAVQEGIKELREAARQEDAYKRTRVNTNASGDWIAATVFVSNALATQIVMERDNRGDTVVTNWSGNDIYVSHEPFADVSGGPVGDAARIPANGSRTIRCQTGIWARGTVATPQQVDVIEEIG
jgi:hypothetical protein